jgi:hypothetical protein
MSGLPAEAEAAGVLDGVGADPVVDPAQPVTASSATAAAASLAITAAR